MAAAIGLAIAMTIIGWPRREPPSHHPTQREEVPEQPAASSPAAIRLVVRPLPKERLSDSSFIGTDGRMYSSYDTDGDGLYDADEIRQYGTVMYDPRTRQNAQSIEHVETPSPDDTDGDGLPDEWEMGYFGALDFGPDDDPDDDGFPNRAEFALGQSPIAIDLLDPIRKLSSLRPVASLGGGFSTASREFWDKQSEAAERVASGKAATQPAQPGYVWKPKPVKLGRQIVRTCPAEHPWRHLLNRSLRPEEDTDGDGLPDEWEKHYFGYLQHGRHDDPDGDGFPNIAEFYRGTDPNRIDLLPLSLKPEQLIRVAPPEDPWDIAWDVRSDVFWEIQERLAAMETMRSARP